MVAFPGAASAPETSTVPVVVGLGGTSRDNSSTRIALEVALAAARAAGTETVLLGAAALQLPLYDPAAPSFQVAESLVSQVRRADGLIIASPGYHGGPSGVIKNALDYLEELRADARPYLEGRAVGIIVCASGWQATATALVSLRSMVHALRGWPTPLGVAINSSESQLATSGSAREHLHMQLETLGRQVAEFAHSRSRTQ